MKELNLWEPMNSLYGLGLFGFPVGLVVTKVGFPVTCNQKIHIQYTHFSRMCVSISLSMALFIYTHVYAHVYVCIIYMCMCVYLSMHVVCCRYISMSIDMDIWRWMCVHVHDAYACLCIINPLQIKEIYGICFPADLNLGPYHQPKNEDICEIINGRLKWDSITLFALIYWRPHTP